MVNVINVTAIWQLLWSSRRSFWVTSAVAAGIMCLSLLFLLPKDQLYRFSLSHMPFAKWKLGYEKARGLYEHSVIFVRWCGGVSWYSQPLIVYLSNIHTLSEQKSRVENKSKTATTTKCTYEVCLMRIND